MFMAYYSVKDILRLFGFSALYAIFAYIALTYLVFPNGVAAIWPASGVFLAAFLQSPRSQWWVVAIVLGTIDFILETTSGAIPLLTSAVFSLSLTIQAITSAWMLQRYLRQRLQFGTLKEVYTFMLWGCALPVIVFAVPPAIVSTLLLAGDPLSVWLWWSISSGMGVLVICPLLLTWYPDFIMSVRRLPMLRRIELITLLIMIVLITRFVFTTSNPQGAALASYSYLTFPGLLLLAIRFNSSSTIFASFLLALIAIWYDGSTLFDRGNSVIALEAFLLVVIGGALLVAALVTERKQVARELDKHRNDLELLVADRTAKLEDANKEMESFSYSVSHDLRAPLRTLDGFSSALLEDYGDKIDENGKQYLERIRRGATRMGKLIDDLLSLSKVARCEMKKERTDLSVIAKMVVEQLKDYDSNRQVDTSIDIANGIYGCGDDALIKIVMDNLLGNAWKYTGTTENSCIEFFSKNDNGHIVYIVRDNGVGFDMRYVEKLFGSFQRLHDSSEFEGSGIGLATVARIIHRHGGRVWAESEVGKGATFYFTLGEQKPDAKNHPHR